MIGSIGGPGGVRNLKLRNEVQTVTIPAAGGRSLSGLVRVRGIDARERAENAEYVPFVPSESGWSGARFILFQQREPIAVVVENPDGTVRRMKIEPAGQAGIAVAFAAIPLAALAARRLMRRRRR